MRIRTKELRFMTTSSSDAQKELKCLLDQVQQAFSQSDDLLIIGIANGGITLAQYLHAHIPSEDEVGILNPIFHRDDLEFNPLPKSFQPTQIPFEIEGRNVLLVDDVFASGRTLRASLNELFDHGRPDSVHFACLFSTKKHKLPFSPNFVGGEISIPTNSTLNVDLVLSPTLNCRYQISSK